jgi:uncharacterized protein YyaL (SSP411 family)
MGSNHLATEQSPYLIQHKDNPVWWYPWSDLAFNKAKAENKPIFLSIGYSTCHWCHVMEKDSFEKDDVAAVLNSDFISIKVDREERPDVDAIYMNAVQVLSGRGGWPLSALLTPEGNPFWAGTFLPKDNFISLLTQVAELWKTKQDEIKNSSNHLAEHLEELSKLQKNTSFEVTRAPLIEFKEGFISRFDPEHGGARGAPKFPSSLSLSLLLRIYNHEKSVQTLSVVTKTLDQMRRGGIYDQVGGGLHRYSTDEKWMVPHFEKMLYDNALLTITLLEAYQVTKNPNYVETARDISNYVLRDMTHKDGGFYSAEDADSESIEGKFYVWTEEELAQILSKDEFNLIKQNFNVTAHGNFETHVTGEEIKPHKGPPALVGNHFYMNPDATLPSIETKAALEKLRVLREKRVRPHLDDKVVTGWNALEISALAKAFQVTGDQKFLKAAERAAHFISTYLKTKDGRLLRSYRNTPSEKAALAEDYSFYIEALLNLYECDFKDSYFTEALQLQDIFDEVFWDKKDGAYFESDGTDSNLILRLKNFEDSVIPSANGTAALNGLRFFSFTGDQKHLEKTQDIIKSVSPFLEKYPQGNAKLLQAIEGLTSRVYELAVIIPDSETNISEILKLLRQKFTPHLNIALKTQSQKSVVPLLENRTLMNNQNTFYLCQNQACLLPTNSVKEILQKIEE